MQLDHYPLEVGRNLVSFEFVSIGPKGRIIKIIQFTPTEVEDIFNLSLADKDLATGKVNYLAVSNNRDTEKILATVVSAIYSFTDRFQTAWIFAEGSTDARTRLYQISVFKYLEKINEDFFILGKSNNTWEPLVKGKRYEAFVVKRK